MTIEFLLGERKYLDFLITHKTNDAFTIRQAEYTLSRGDRVVSNGDCVIDGHKLSAFIEPNARGHYMLELTYLIGAETRKARYFVDVG